jgi:hypothetical protein
MPANTDVTAGSDEANRSARWASVVHVGNSSLISFEERNDLPSKRLRRSTNDFRGRETEWRHDGAEMIRRTANFARERNELAETEMLSLVRREAHACPCRATVCGDLAGFRTRLEKLEG